MDLISLLVGTGMKLNTTQTKRYFNYIDRTEFRRNSSSNSCPSRNLSIGYKLTPKSKIQIKLPQADRVAARLRQSYRDDWSFQWPGCCSTGPRHPVLSTVGWLQCRARQLPSPKQTIRKKNDRGKETDENESRQKSMLRCGGGASGERKGWEVGEGKGNWRRNSS